MIRVHQWSDVDNYTTDVYCREIELSTETGLIDRIYPFDANEFFINYTPYEAFNVRELLELYSD